MPRGGWRGGGRPKGSKSKKQVEREDLARLEHEKQEQRHRGMPRDLAIDTLDSLMKTAMNYAALYQPRIDVVNRSLIGGNEEKFERWAKLAGNFARDLAKYQSPTFAAIAVKEVPALPSMPGMSPAMVPGGGNDAKVISAVKEMTIEDKIRVYENIVRTVGREH